MVLRYVLPSCEKVFQFFLITRKNKLTKNFIDSVNQDGQAPLIQAPLIRAHKRLASLDQPTIYVFKG